MLAPRKEPPTTDDRNRIACKAVHRPDVKRLVVIEVLAPEMAARSLTGSSRSHKIPTSRRNLSAQISFPVHS